MKNLILIFAVALLFSFGACGQTSREVPVSVKNAFSQKFPAATKVKFGRENDKEWEVEFKLDGKSYSANYDNEGNWMETEYAISKNEIPKAVQASIDKDFAAYRISESEISETAKGKAYEFILKKTGEKIEVAFDVDGKLINKEQAKEEDEEND